MCGRSAAPRAIRTGTVPVRFRRGGVALARCQCDSVGGPAGLMRFSAVSVSIAIDFLVFDCSSQDLTPTRKHRIIVISNGPCSERIAICMFFFSAEGSRKVPRGTGRTDFSTRARRRSSIFNIRYSVFDIQPSMPACRPCDASCIHFRYSSVDIQPIYLRGEPSHLRLGVLHPSTHSPRGHGLLPHSSLVAGAASAYGSPS